MTERTPPQNIEMEMAVLGGIMLEPQTAYPLAANILTPDAFYYDGHREVWNAMARLHQRGIPPDSVAVLAELKRESNTDAQTGQTYYPLLNKVGGSGVVLGMLNSVATAANVEHHARIVREHYWRRELIAVCSSIARAAYRSDVEWEQLREGAANRILRVTEYGGCEEDPTHIADVLNRYIAEMELRVDEIERQVAAGVKAIDVSPGYRTGFPDLDRMLGGGLRNKELTVIAARPSKGKSAMAANIIYNLTVGNQTAGGEQIPCLLITIEMGEEQIAERLLSRGSYTWSQSLGKLGVSVTRLRNPVSLTQQEWNQLERADQRLRKAPIYIWDKGVVTPRDLRALAGRLLRKHRQLVVFIDYLQLLTAHTRNENLVARVTEVSQSCKQLAKDYGIPVVALSQFSREVEKQKRVPQLSDLRESGAIEQDADAVILIHPREETEAGTGFSRVDWIVAKNRNGPCGTVQARYDAELMRFVSVAPEYRNG